MDYKGRHIFVPLLILIFSVPALSQYNLEAQLSNILTNGFDETYIREYTKPLATALSTGMGGAQYHRAYTKGFPRFDAGISGVYLLVPDDDLDFLFQGDEVPTFFGSKSSINSVLGTELEGFLLQQLHVNVGLFANLELMARGFKFTVGEIGDISMLGFGVKYGLSDLIPIPVFPIDFSVQALYQTLNIGDWVNSGTFGMNLNASKGLVVFPIDIYAGVGFETSTLTIKTNDIPGISQFGIGDVSIDTDNFRLNLGVSWTLLILNIHADYNIGEYNSIGGGIMVVL
jgi:hypothetical protein